MTEFNKSIKVSKKSKYKPTQDEIKKIAELCIKVKDIFPQCYKFINTYQEAQAPAIIKTLEAIERYKPNGNSIWGYALQVLKNEYMNCNAEHNLKEHEANKKGDLKGFKEVLRGLLQSLEG